MRLYILVLFIVIIDYFMYASVKHNENNSRQQCDLKTSNFYPREAPINYNYEVLILQNSKEMPSRYCTVFIRMQLEWHYHEEKTAVLNVSF